MQNTPTKEYAERTYRARNIQEVLEIIFFLKVKYKKTTMV